MWTDHLQVYNWLDPKTDIISMVATSGRLLASHIMQAPMADLQIEHREKLRELALCLPGAVFWESSPYCSAEQYVHSVQFEPEILKLAA